MLMLEIQQDCIHRNIDGENVLFSNSYGLYFILKFEKKIYNLVYSDFPTEKTSSLSTKNSHFT